MVRLAPKSHNGLQRPYLDARRAVLGPERESVTEGRVTVDIAAWSAGMHSSSYAVNRLDNWTSQSRFVSATLWGQITHVRGWDLRVKASVKTAVGIPVATDSPV